MVRNDFIFRGIQLNMHLAKERFKNGFALVILRAKSSLKQVMSLWLDTSTTLYFLFLFNFLGFLSLDGPDNFLCPFFNLIYNH
jgi:hypothetical protein